MKKVAAFLTAFTVFVIIAVALHVTAVKVQPTENRDFGYWISSAKDSSYELLAKNIGEKTALYMGSSEFHHGLKHSYNPSNLFRKTDLDLMCLGAAFNQSLTHAITVGAVGPKLKNKKVCLILSPTWFYKHRSKQAGREFLLRYSSTCFDKAMENDKLSAETREAIKTRKELLLGESGGKSDVKAISKALGKEKDIVKTSCMWIGNRGAEGTGHRGDGAKDEPVKLDFSSLREEVESYGTGEGFTNPYNMEDRIFNRKFKIGLDGYKNKNANLSFEESGEYGDLQIFLDVCKEQNLDVLLILQPMNGKWYDYTGFTAEKRHVVSEQVEKIAADSGVKLCDLTNEEYTEGFFEDAVHPSKKGWVIINEKAYDFFNS